MGLLIDQNFSDGIDYADPKDDRGLHSNTVKRYLYLPFSFQKLSPQMGNFLVAKNFAFNRLGTPLIRNSFFFFYKKCAFGLKTAFPALFGRLCSWLVFAYFLTSFDPKKPLLSLLCDCFYGHIQEQKEAGRGYLPCGPIMQNNIGRSLNAMLLLS